MKTLEGANMAGKAGRGPGLVLGIALVVALTAAAASGETQTWSTGDLGNNIIWDAGSFEVTANLTDVVTNGPAEMLVKYGLWNSPDVLVDAYVNSTWVGDFLADDGYIWPGPEYVTFDVTGLLKDGDNPILFTGHGAKAWDYVIGQVDLTYTVPEPAALSLLALGALALTRRRRE